MKLCALCKEEKEDSLFYKKRNELTSWCKICCNKKSRKWHFENRDRQLAIMRKSIAKTRYGLTYEEYQSIINRGCEVCKTAINLCIDHNHKTGKVRGCLCRKCNAALGLLNDNTDLVGRLHAYISNGL